jgi:hypothetical protein
MALAGVCVTADIRKLLHSIAKLCWVYAKAYRCLCIRHTAFLDQAHSLKLELPGKQPSLRDTLPAP